LHSNYLHVFQKCQASGTFFFPLCLFSSHLQVSQVNEVMVFENAGGVDENITR